jgi:hypothetical protein
MKKTFNIVGVFNIALIIAVSIGSFFLGKSCNTCEETTTTISLTDEQRKNIISEAQEGWIPKDSVDKLLANHPVKSEAKYTWSVKDSVVYNYKDSTIVDTVEVYEPVIEATQEEITEFEYHEEQYDVKLSLAVKPKYFPLRKVFSTDVGVKSLQVTLRENEPKESWLNNLISLGVYGGYGYDIARKEYGFQIGVGIQLRLLDFKLN